MLAMGFLRWLAGDHASRDSYLRACAVLPAASGDNPALQPRCGRGSSESRVKVRRRAQTICCKSTSAGASFKPKRQGPARTSPSVRRETEEKAKQLHCQPVDTAEPSQPLALPVASRYLYK